MAVTRARVFAASIVTIAALYLFPDRMIAPGKLKDAHTGFGKDCFACHELFHGAKSEKCQSCHAIDPHGSMTTVGVMRRDDARAMPFHQALTEKNCLGCHSDHEGMKAYRAPVSFSHQLLAPEVRTQCASCHKKPEDVLHQKITGACIQCHNQTKWRATTFDH